jgi:pimeloyl-ACP methyl ester carboxylesterase
MDPTRRHILHAVSLAAAARPLACLGVDDKAAGRPASEERVMKQVNTGSFGTLQRIEAGGLEVAYAAAGPSGGTPVVLLHGWPYDIHSYVEVAPLLASHGYRAIIPYLRGYGTTRFLSGDAMRNGQQSALALDVVSLLDGLGIESAMVAGFDWGARSANTVAALFPERCKAMVSVSGYLIGSREVNKQPLTPKAELAWWY